jgi:hypothetical protein
MLLYMSTFLYYPFTPAKFVCLPASIFLFLYYCLLDMLTFPHSACRYSKCVSLRKVCASVCLLTVLFVSPIRFTICDQSLGTIGIHFVGGCTISRNCALVDTSSVKEVSQKGDFLGFLKLQYGIQHCVIGRPSDSILSEDIGIDPRTVAISALAVRRSIHSARSHRTSLTHVKVFKKKFDTYRKITDRDVGIFLYPSIVVCATHSGGRTLPLALFTV